MKSAAYLVLALVLLTGCQTDCVTGEGDPINETRTVEDFEVLHLDCSADIYLRQAQVSDVNKIVISAQENLIPFIKTTINGSRLEVEMEGCTISTENIELEILVSNLTKIVNDGSGDIQSVNTLKGESMKVLSQGSGQVRLDFKGESLEGINHGSGQMILSGDVEDLELSSSGSGGINSYEMKCVSAEAENEGSGDVSLYVSEELEVNLTGSGDVNYKGDPAEIDQQDSGSGEVKHVN